MNKQKKYILYVIISDISCMLRGPEIVWTLLDDKGTLTLITTSHASLFFNPSSDFNFLFLFASPFTIHTNVEVFNYFKTLIMI